MLWVDHCIQRFLLCTINNTNTGPAQPTFSCHSVAKPNRIQNCWFCLYWLNSCFWKSRSLLANLVPRVSCSREALGTSVTADFDYHTCHLSWIIQESPRWHQSPGLLHRSPNLPEKIEFSYELFCTLIWNLSHFLPKFEFSLINSSVSGAFLHIP